MTRGQRAWVWIVALEVLLGAGAIVWRLSRPPPPQPNLSHLPPATAGDLRRLQQAVWSDRPAPWLELGEAYLAFGFFYEADLCLQRAAAADPNSFDAAFGSAYAAERLGQIEESNRRWEVAARLGVNPEACWYHIGRNLLRKEDPRAAERAFESSGDLPESLYERARIQVRDGRPSQALQLIEKLQSQIGLDVRVEMLAVAAHRELGDRRAAMLAAERAERAESRLALSDHWAYLQPVRARYGLDQAFSRAQLLAQEGHSREASELFQQVFEANDWRHVESMLLTGVRLGLQGRRPESVRTLLAKAEERLALSPEMLRHRGSVEAIAGDLDRAVATWTRAASLEPHPDVHQHLAQAYHEQKNEKAAAAEETEAVFLTAVAAYRANQASNARELLERVQRRMQQDARFWFALGELHLAERRFTLAHSAYERCLELAPHHGFAAERRDALPPPGAPESARR